VILKRNVWGDTADIVYGLGGGEGAYKDALCRLKATCGSRSVMRAVHLEAYNREEAPKRDPASFRRYAEKVRTHLFNLSYIGEAGHADIIERLTQNLQIQDRLSWNDGRQGGLEHRTINEFGVWLCARASAYQNAYSIAADQYQKPNQTPRHQPQQTSYGSKRNVHVHHGAGTFLRQEGKGEENQEAEEHCFKCEESHLLHNCTFFKAPPVSDRTTFVMRQGLCFCCLGIRHNAHDCKEKKSCTIGRCKLSHHPLLHNEAVGDAKSCHEMDSEPKPIAFGVIQLEAESTDGELIPVSLFIDPESTATFFREGIVRSLKLDGHSQTLRVEGVAETSSVAPSEYLDLRIRTAFGEVVTIQGSTLRSVTKPVPFMNWELWRKRWPHLDDIPEIRPAGGRIDILIGLNHNTYTTATESRIGGDDEPTAEKTRLAFEKLNSVDIATHSQLEEEAVPYSWLKSSSFLLEQLSAWPMDSPWMAEKEEMRSARLNIDDSQAILVFNWTYDRIMSQERPALIQRDEKYRTLTPTMTSGGMSRRYQMPNHVIEADFVPPHSSLIPDPESETSSGENGAVKCFIIKILLLF
jgi:hypothetical protein